MTGPNLRSAFVWILLIYVDSSKVGWNKCLESEVSPRGIE